MLVVNVPPHSRVSAVLVLTMLACGGLTMVTRAAEDEAIPAASGTDEGDSPRPADTVQAEPTGESTDSAPPRFRYPQPSLRHATPRYEARYVIPPADAALVRRLEEPLPDGGIRLPENATLLDLEDWLSQQAKVRVRIDWRALEDSGRDAESPLETTQMEGVDLRAALRTLLGEIDLAAIVKDGSLLVTHMEAADENLIVGFYPLPTQVDAGNLQNLIDLIQSTVAADCWDTVGGPGAIRPAEEANTLVISQTQEVHAEILALMRSEFDGDLVPDGGQAGQIPTRVHRVRGAALATEIAAALVALCNAALGPAGDPAAKVTRLGEDRLVVQSASRPFQVYAAEMIRAINGFEDQEFAPGMDLPAPPDGNPFCWVAREVYGPENPRWLIFRSWLTNEAPAWLRAAYAAHGEAIATWLRDRPLAKAALRTFMNAVPGY